MPGKNPSIVLDDLQYIVTEQIAAQLVVSDIHTHALKRNSNGRVHHLPGSIETHPSRSSNVEKTSADRSSNRGITDRGGRDW